MKSGRRIACIRRNGGLACGPTEIARPRSNWSKLWNKLAEQHRFALLCAYPIAGFNGDGLATDSKTSARAIRE